MTEPRRNYPIRVIRSAIRSLTDRSAVEYVAACSRRQGRL